MAEESEEVWANRRAAWRALKALEQKNQEIYEQGPVARMLATDTNGEPLVPDAEVPGLFFHDSPTSASDIMAYLRTDADPIAMEDYGGFLLRQFAEKPEGGFDIAALDAWTKRYSSALSALPGLANKIADLREAETAHADAVAKSAALMAAFLASPAQLFFEFEPTIAAGKLFEFGDSTAAMCSILEIMAGNEAGIAGLKASVSDFLTSKLDLTDEGEEAYLEIVDRHYEALQLLLDDAGVAVLQNVAADIRRSRLSKVVNPPAVTREGRAPESKPKRGWRAFWGK